MCSVVSLQVTVSEKIMVDVFVLLLEFNLTNWHAIESFCRAKQDKELKSFNLIQNEKKFRLRCTVDNKSCSDVYNI